MKKIIDIYYYSGTGNTILVMNEMARVLKDHQYEVNLCNIEDTNPADIRQDVTIGLAFPVAFQSTFPFLWDFFHAMPESKGTEIFMIDTMMAFSGAIVGPLKKLFKGKGYKCIGAKEIVMPSNWFPKKVDETKNNEKVARGLQKANQYALDLINGKTSWRRIPFLSDLFYKLCCNDYMMNNVNTKPGKNIEVDRSKCKSCGICSRICPVGNITMNEGPNWSDRCQTCMRCLSFCPQSAIYIKDKKFVLYRAVELKELNTFKGEKN